VLHLLLVTVRQDLQENVVRLRFHPRNAVKNVHLIALDMESVILETMNANVTHVRQETAATLVDVVEDLDAENTESVLFLQQEVYADVSVSMIILESVALLHLIILLFVAEEEDAENTEHAEDHQADPEPAAVHQIGLESAAKLHLKNLQFVAEEEDAENTELVEDHRVNLEPVHVRQIGLESAVKLHLKNLLFVVEEEDAGDTEYAEDHRVNLEPVHVRQIGLESVATKGLPHLQFVVEEEGAEDTEYAEDHLVNLEPAAVHRIGLESVAKNTKKNHHAAMEPDAEITENASYHKRVNRIAVVNADIQDTVAIVLLLLIHVGVNLQQTKKLAVVTEYA